MSVHARGWGWCLAVGLVVGSAAAQGDGKKTPPAGPPVDKAAPEHVMTKAEADTLFKQVDEIMAFAAADSGLPPVIKVKRRLVTRDEVNKYLVKNFEEDESAKRLQRSEIVLKKFGLLNRDFDLRPFLLSLLTEQVAGYYDDKTKVVNMLNWVPAEEQQPVLAHELTHAIQDQRVNLTKWGDSGFKGVSHTASEDNDRIRTDELETARQAVAEGQAMVVFVDWGLKGTGKTLADAPEIGQRMKDAASDTSSSPVLSRAPLLLQRSLAFPYADGLAFEQALLIAGGKKAAFADALATPPSSSFEVMHPDKFLAHATVPVLLLPDIHPILDAEYESYDIGVMGELDVEIMASLFGGREVGQALAPAWNGGIYYAAQRKAAAPAEKQTAESLGVFYYSKWKTAKAANAFAAVYEAQLARKYSGLRERKTDEEGTGEHVFSTREGDVVMKTTDNGVFISEGFPLATARKLRESVTTAQATGPLHVAGAGERVPSHELTLGLMAGFGLMNRYTLVAR